MKREVDGSVVASELPAPVQPGPAVLVVRHGEGRGRLKRYMQPVFEELYRRPGAEERVRLHDTGGPQPSLDGVSAVLFWLADPLRELYPRCYEEAVRIAEAARSRGIPTVNPPEALSNSIKSRQSRLWLDAGFLTPPWSRFRGVDELRDLAEEVGYPLLIRDDEAHAQNRQILLIADERELDRVEASVLPSPGAVAPFWDVRQSYRSTDPRSIYARLHHKKRVWVFGSRVFSEHVFFSKNPIVCSGTYTFGRYHRRLPSWLHWLGRVRKRDRLAIREDIDYWRRGEDHAETIASAAEALGLGFAAIDCSRRADGEVVLWEANPFPQLPPLQLRMPRQRLSAERVPTYLRAFGDFLLELADAEPVTGSAMGT